MDDNISRNECPHEEPSQTHLSGGRLIQKRIHDYFKMSRRELIDLLTLEANQTPALRAATISKSVQRANQTSLTKDDNAKGKVSGDGAGALGQDDFGSCDGSVVGEPRPLNPKRDLYNRPRECTEVRLELCIMTSTGEEQNLSFDTLDLRTIPSAAQQLVDYVAVLDDNPQYPHTFHEYRGQVGIDSSQTDDVHGKSPSEQNCYPFATVASDYATVLDVISVTPNKWICDSGANMHLANDINWIQSLTPNTRTMITNNGVEIDMRSVSNSNGDLADQHCVACLPVNTPSQNLTQDQTNNAFSENLAIVASDDLSDRLECELASVPTSGHNALVVVDVVDENGASIGIQDDKVTPSALHLHEHDRKIRSIAPTCFAAENSSTHGDNGQDCSTHRIRKSQRTRKPPRSRKSPAQRARLHDKVAHALTRVPLSKRKQEPTSGYSA
jgi:hypothetical protein